jgi:hypothetical protein
MTHAELKDHEAGSKSSLHLHHQKAAEHHEHAAKHHKEAGKHHQSGDHKAAAHHAHIAHGHTEQAVECGAEAAKSFSNTHGLHK